jgi:diguanylate cyclase (GGDEF)-like protein/PAS domain S-box-containing protein
MYIDRHDIQHPAGSARAVVFCLDRSGQRERGFIAKTMSMMLAALKEGVAPAGNEAALRAVIDSVLEQIAVIDGNGLIVLVNHSWRDFATRNSLEPGQPAPNTDVGTNYLDVCRASGPAIEADHGGNAAAGIQAVLDGRLSRYTLDYACHSAAGPRWFSMRVAPLVFGAHGAVITHVDISEQKRAEAELEAKEALYRSVTDTGQALIWLSGLDGGCYYFNQPWLAFTGRTLQQEFGNGWTEGVHADDIDACLEVYTKAFERREKFSMIYRLRRHDGEYRSILDDGTPRFDAKGDFAGYVGHCLDVTEHQRAEQESRRSEEALKLQNGLFSTLLNNLHVGVFMVEAPTGKPLVANDAALKLLGRGILPDASRHNLATVYKAYRIGTREPYPPEEMPILLAMQGETSRRNDMLIERPDGSTRLLEVFGSPVIDDTGRIWASLASFSDITDRKRMEDQVRELAFHDALTGLPNRRLLNDRLSQALTSNRRNGRHGALLFLDLDNFKPLNDTHGHGVGDLLLIQAAERLKSCVREIDTVARFGGDEFVLILRDLDADQADAIAQVAIVAEKIRDALARPYLLTLDNSERPAATVDHRCSASIGVTLFGGVENSRDDILKWADQAMYQAKDAGRNVIRFHETRDPV